MEKEKTRSDIAAPAGVPELLAPAGSFESLEAAVSAGADAVYLGMTSFNARANAKNFGDSALRDAVSLAHGSSVKIYITLNTLIYDREFPEWLRTAEKAAELGADALIVADAGGASLLRRFIPEMPLHASTQMSVHNAEGGRRLVEAGFSRIVPAREMSREDIRYFVANTGAETEIFVHGALCVSCSGQCLFSSLVGGRSGNRGECAQPCRLPYTVGGKTSYPLSLRDLSLASRIPEILDLGVSSLKIEGRMKSPAYVSAAVSVFRRLLDERRAATPGETEYLSSVFSRDGFTDAYFTGERTASMFGRRREDAGQTAPAHNANMSFPGRKRPAATPRSVGLDAPAAPSAHPAFTDAQIKSAVKEASSSAGKPARIRTAVFFDPASYTAEADSFFDISYIPLEYFAVAAKSGRAPRGVMLPPVITDSETDGVRSLLKSAAEAGATDLLVGNIGHLRFAEEFGMTPHGDYRLNITNSPSALVASEEGFRDFILSPELTLPRMRDIGGRKLAVVYGRVPLMTTGVPVGDRRADKNAGSGTAPRFFRLTDRRGVSFPALDISGRTLIFNSVPFWTADRTGDIAAAGLCGTHFVFTVEKPEDVRKVIGAYRNGLPFRAAFPAAAGRSTEGFRRIPG